MTRFTICLFALVMLAACSTQETDSCAPSAGRRLLADTLSGGATELAFRRKQQACEDERRADQKAVELCVRALQNSLDRCNEACKPREVLLHTPDCAKLTGDAAVTCNKFHEEADPILVTKSDNALTMAAVASKMKCAEQTQACQVLAPCTWMSTGKGGDEYDQDACLISLEADPVCKAALANVADEAERGKEEVNLAQDIGFQVMMIRSAAHGN